MKIVIISKKDATERRVHIAEHMRSSKHEWHFVDAAEGEPIAELPLHPDARRLKGRDVPRGGIGCFQSHWLLWREFAKSDDDWLCVLEDDVLLDLSFDLDLLIKTLEDAGAHYIRLHFLYLRPYEKLGRFGRRTIIRFKSSPLGTQAYLISRTAASRLAQSITEIRTSIDDEMDKFWVHGLPVLALFPFPALELGVPSTIVTKPFQRDPRNLRDVAYRQSTKLLENARRLSSNFELRRFDDHCRRTFSQQAVRL